MRPFVFRTMPPKTYILWFFFSFFAVGHELTHSHTADKERCTKARSGADSSAALICICANISRQSGDVKQEANGAKWAPGGSAVPLAKPLRLHIFLFFFFFFGRGGFYCTGCAASPLRRRSASFCLTRSRKWQRRRDSSGFSLVWSLDGVKFS